MRGKRVFGVSIAILIIMALSLSLSCASPAATTAPLTSTVAPTTLAPTTSVPTSANPSQVIKLSFALFQPPTSAVSIMNTAFAKEIEKRTNGQVQITVYQGGAMLGGPAMYTGILNGIADMGNSSVAQTPNTFPFIENTANWPIDFQSGWAASSAMYDFFMKYPTDFNKVHVLTVSSVGFDALVIGTSKAPILKLEDFKGKSLRASTAAVAVALGATLKDAPMANVYDLISKGVLDGFMANCEPLLSWKLADVCKYFTVNTCPIQTSNLYYNIMNKDKWNSLPPDIQKTITEVGVEYSAKIGLTWDDSQVAGVQYAKSLGCSFYVLPQDEEARWTAACTPILDANLKKLTDKGFTQQEVQDALNYSKSRMDYWNGQQAQNKIIPSLARIEAAFK